MVSKSKVYAWFKKCESHERLDLLCSLFSACLPFELRFLRTCLEDLEKKDEVLKELDHSKFDISRLAESQDLDELGRSRLIIHISLMEAKCSEGCRDIIEFLKKKGNPDAMEIDDRCQYYVSQMLLIYTLISLHPAFSFIHRSLVWGYMEALKVKLKEKKNIGKSSSDSSIATSPSGPIQVCIYTRLYSH